MKTLFLPITLLIVLVACTKQPSPSPEEAVSQKPKPRTIVTTDGEVDDVDSFIRMLLYTNEFKLEGLVYSSSQWHYKGDGKGTLFTSEMPYTAERYGKRPDLRWPGTAWMQNYVGKYEAVYEKLKQHSPDYPTPAYLLGIIKTGNIDFEGDMKSETEGSNLIRDVLLDETPGPVYLQVWGGTNTVARALKSIEEKYAMTETWDSVYKKVSEKAVLYTVLDQDATYKNYVAKVWPDIKVLYNSDQFWSFAYLWPRVVPDQLKSWLGGEWFAKNIVFQHGPLMESYFTWGDGRMIEGDPEHTHGNMDEAKKFKRQQYDFISEGDSPAYFYLLDVGLRSLEDPSYGGWGGRMVQSPVNPYRWEDGKHVTDINLFSGQPDTTFPQTRWIDAIQNDFAARADWCVMAYDSANHPPRVSLEHAADLVTNPGETIQLHGKAEDPDGDALQFRWWHYREAGSYKGTVSIRDHEIGKASFIVPADAKPGETIHVICEVHDNGTPSLTRYQRVIVKITN